MLAFVPPTLAGNWGGSARRSFTAAAEDPFAHSKHKIVKRQMTELIENGDVDGIVVLINDAYAPLVRDLEERFGPLNVSMQHKNAHCNVDAAMQFDDVLVKLMEREAAALLMANKRPDLIVRIYENRCALEATIQDLANTSTGHDVGHVVDAIAFAQHFPRFCEDVMDAYNTLGQYEEALAVYDRATSRPTSAMISLRMRLLSRVKKNDELLSFYEQVREQGVPLDKMAYRQLLFAAAQTGRHGVVKQVLDRMKRDGIKQDGVNYTNAIRAFDALYYFHAITKPDDEKKRDDHERDVLLDDQAQPSSPVTKSTSVRFHRLAQAIQEDAVFDDIASEQGARVVLELFDAMVQQDRIVPKSAHVYARAMMAAVKLQELHRVREILALQETRAKVPLHKATVMMAVNGYLLLDRPDLAWQVVQYHTPAPANVYESIPLQDLLGYCREHKQHVSVLRSVLDHYKGNDRVQQLLSNGVAFRLLQWLCGDHQTFSDADLWQLVTSDYQALFRVTTKPFWFHKFLFFSAKARRHAIVHQLLDARDRTVIAQLPASTGLAALEIYAESSDVAMMAKIFGEIDLDGGPQEPTDLDKAAQACFLMARALHQAGRTSDVAALHAKHHPVFARADQAMPDDVRQILQQCGKLPPATRR